MDPYESRIKTILVAQAGLALLSVLIALVTIFRPFAGPVPFRVRDGPVTAVHEVCPGATLTYPMHLEIRQAPVTIMLVESYWDVARQQTAWGDDAPVWGVWTAPAVVEREWTTVVPALPPGRYELRAALQEPNSRPGVITVPLQVRADCGAHETG